MQFEQIFKQTKRPIVGGTLLILAGILGVLWWGTLAIYFTVATGTIEIGNLSLDLENLRFRGLLVSIILFIFSLFCLAGGMLAGTRKSFSLSIGFGILGVLSMGPFLLSSLFSLGGIILITAAEDEFY